MSLPLGKLTILVGAGIVGSVLAKDGNVPYVSGALKFVFRQLKHDDSTPSGNKPRNDYLMAQVNSLRQELQMLASNRPITIVTGRGTGSSKYVVIIVVVVVGYGYIWWKGWRLPDMMFATRRSLSDARDSIAKQLDSVYSSISVTRRQLSSRIEGVDNHLNEIADISATTQDEVSLLQDKSKTLNTNVQSVRYVVQTLESKINRIEGKQDMTNQGVNYLLDYAQTIEQNGPTDRIQASPTSSSRPALEAPTRIPSRVRFFFSLMHDSLLMEFFVFKQTGSLPPIVQVESPGSSDSDGTHMVKRSPRHVISASGLKEVGESSSNDVANGDAISENKSNGSSSSSGFFGMMFSGGPGSLLTRTRSATNAVPRSSRQ